jgi:hypothetical protein
LRLRVAGKWFANRVREVKLFQVGCLVGLVIGLVLTVLYFSLATFFAVNAKALEATQKAAENRKENGGDATAANGSLNREIDNLVLEQIHVFKQFSRLSDGEILEYNLRHQHIVWLYRKLDESAKGWFVPNRP